MKCLIVACAEPAAPGKWMCVDCQHYYSVVLADDRFRHEPLPLSPAAARKAGGEQAALLVEVVT